MACRAILNVCFAYTGRDEIVTAAQDIATAVNDGTLLDRYLPYTSELLIAAVIFVRSLWSRHCSRRTCLHPSY